MKTRTLRFIFVILSLYMNTEMLHAQTYNKLWKEVEKAQANGLPQTAIKYTEEIYRKAEAEKNPGQMLKAYTARSGYRQSIAPDSFYVDLKGLEKWAAATTVREDRAVLHTLIAKTYSDYAGRNRYNLQWRTDLIDTPSEDIREWGGNMFAQKVLNHTHAALEDSVLLFGLSTEGYIPFVRQQEYSKYYHHNVYHFLASYGVSSIKNISFLMADTVATKEITAIYSSLEQLYRKQDNKDALTLLALEGLQWQKETGEMSSDAYLTNLDYLTMAFAGHPISVEAYLVKARELSNQNKKPEALQVCKDAIAEYPNYDRINALKELQNEILNPSLAVRIPTSMYPEDTLSLQVNHRNLDGFTVHIYKVDLPGSSPLLSEIQQDKNRKKYASKKLSSQHFTLERPANYEQTNAVFSLVTPLEGVYLVEIVPDKATDTNRISQLLSVTRFKLLSRALPYKRFEVAVLDGKSGQPVPEATIRIFTAHEGNAMLSQTVTSNADGRVELDWDTAYRYIGVEKGADTGYTLQGVRRGGYEFYDRKAEHEVVTLLTDRSLYRPGQTVYLKGVVYKQLSDTANVVAGIKYTVSLVDANRREVSKKDLVTNDFGSFTAEFVLPSGGLNGQYSLRVANSEVAIRVEEYKRPTFEITLNKPEESYKLGDTIKLNGLVKTYSGVPVQELPVRYVVARNLYGWWGQYNGSITVGSGEAQLNDAGEFTLPVTLTPDKSHALDYGYYVFNISATVTNVAGETQTTTTTVAAGNRSLLLSVNTGQPINKDADIQLTFSARNLDNQPVNVKGEYKLYPFTGQKPDEIAKAPACAGTFTSNISTVLSEWKSLPSGVYKLMLTAKDEQGREATYETQAVLFSIHDKSPAKKTGIWYYGIHTEFDASQPAEFIFGTSDKDAYVLMDVISGDKRLESRSLHLSDSVMRFTYPYKKEYGDGLIITFCYVKNGKSYTHQVVLQKKIPDKELKLSWSVFRDKLRPGQQEEWKLTIQNPDNSFANAELLATMYDASLDRIWKQNQLLKVNYLRTVPLSYWNIYNADNGYYNFRFTPKRIVYPKLLFDAFWMDRARVAPHEMDEIVIMGYGNSLQMSRSADIKIRGTASAPKSAVALEAPMEDLNFALEQACVEETLLEPITDLRTNFAETAFFYPQLRTNEKGEVVIAFTVPESLTRWNFNGYAHTKGMLTGMIDGQVVTSKDFMLTPNLPRFVRVGDNTSVSASVANLTGHEVKGNVTFTLFDPLTERVIAVQKQKFAAEAGHTVGVSFTFAATGTYDLLGCRIIAEGGNFSDGEQHLLPVLSNKERIIETVAMPIRGNQTREFSLDGLFNSNSKTATNRSLTVEFSGNPAWYAVQALPSLSMPDNDNAISWATAYYANTLASYIMNSQPRIKTVFDAWQQQGGAKETFLSNLQKNQEVKNILLEESPWIMEATTGQEQKERIATLFDLNNIRNKNLSALHKLNELQLSDGSWAWYKGMSGSRYITTYVLQQLVRLNNITGTLPDNDAINMRNRAFGFLHKEALSEYNDIRKKSETPSLSSNALQYLYLIAVSGEQVPAENKAAYDYFLNKVTNNISSESVIKKAVSAVILQKAGRATNAQAFISSLKEYTTQTDEQGMYFAFNEDPYSWSGLRVPAHVMVMEAIDLAGNDAAAVDEMKLWLLQQKQTQQWNSPVATANAVYALLYRGTGLIENEGDVRITLGGKVMETLAPMNSAVPGIAYIKETITDKADLAKIKKAVVEKRDAGIAWGAVYAQYEEDIDKVSSHAEGLQVEKKLYVERVTGDKKELLLIDAGSRLKTGDKVVSRVTIKLDRSMDFVQLKDQRGACFEPIGNISGYVRNQCANYYVAVKDASTNFFFDSLSKGVYVLEHGYRVSRAGTYESGLAIVQSAYAPEYAAHSASIKLNIEH